MSENRHAGRAERIAGFVGLAMLAFAATGSIWLAGPPAPLPADAAADRFSAGRAMRDVAALAQAPRPIGSAEHAAAREYLSGRLSELGLAPRVHETTVVRSYEDNRLRAARVRNLVGRLEGRGGGGAVLVVAHYDSRPNTPGAGDDAAGVAVVLEAVRAVAHGPLPAADLIVLLTDAEELGLLGALGFVAEHPWMDEVAVVLNFEGRGSRGPAAMFETGRNDLSLVRAFARSAPQPLASSLSAAVYERMPNDTDFSAFRRHGLGGLNFAFLGGFAAYHTALDTAQRLDPASLQHAGDNAVAVIRRLDPAADLGRDAAGVWFNPLGAWLVVLPATAAVPVAAILSAMLVAILVLGLRLRRCGWPGLRAGALLCAGALLVGPLAGAALWRLFADNAGSLLDTPHGLPHRLELTGLALFLAGLASASFLGGLSRRLPAETALGGAAAWAILALSASALLPGASFLFWWPLWGLLLAIGVTILGDPPRPVAVLFLSAGALPGVALLAPLAMLVFQAMTPWLAMAALAPASLALTLGLPALVAAAGGRQALALAALVASLGALAGAVWDAPDAAHPRTADLVLVEDLDRASASWLSRDKRPPGWLVDRLGEPESREAPSFLGLGEGPLERWPAPPAGASGPLAVEVEDQRDEGRRLTVRLSSPGGAPMLRVEAASTVQVTAVELAGQRFEIAGEQATRPLRLELAGLPPEGLEVSFELAGPWPLELHLTEQFYGLPDAPPWPPGWIPDSSWITGSRLIHRSFLR